MKSENVLLTIDKPEKGIHILCGLPAVPNYNVIIDSLNRNETVVTSKYDDLPIEFLSVLDVVALIKEVEEKFDVEANPDLVYDIDGDTMFKHRKKKKEPHYRKLEKLSKNRYRR